MPIHFNSPDHVQERANVEPLSLNDMRQLVDELNYLIEYHMDQNNAILAQRLIWEYENLKHASMTSPKTPPKV